MRCWTWAASFCLRFATSVLRYSAQFAGISGRRGSAVRGCSGMGLAQLSGWNLPSRSSIPDPGACCGNASDPSDPFCSLLLLLLRLLNLHLIEEELEFSFAGGT